MSKESIIRTVSNHLTDDRTGAILGADEAFMCVYGSSVYGTKNSSADVDLLCAVPDTHVTTIDLDDLSQLIHDTHISYGHEVDQEVPYSNKLVYGFGDLQDAVTLEAFHDDGQGNVVIPQIQKTSNFLASRQIKLRLGLNALTTPNIILCNEDRAVKQYTELAGIAITAAGISLSQKARCDFDNIIAALSLPGPAANNEMYLGYKLEHNSVKEHLQRIIARSMDILANQGDVTEIPRKPGLYKIEPEFNAFNVMKRLTKTFEGAIG